MPIPFTQWGSDIDGAALDQMREACALPVAVAGALMPDAHVGYGLPVGGVLACEGAVIPYAVGVDIACRMRLTVFDAPAPGERGAIDTAKMRSALGRETVFGAGGERTPRARHEVMDRAEWSRFEGITSKEKAWAQLGTSGSGNHFVEFGAYSEERHEGTEAQRHEGGEAEGVRGPSRLALLSHSGSRGTGYAVANHFSRLAKARRPSFGNLAWLDLESEEGQDYWDAMHLMGLYAAANHEIVHREVARNIGLPVARTIENHHNFAWKESHSPGTAGNPGAAGAKREVIVHRKGATPAGVGVLGIIPGSMATPAFIVRGRGVAESLESCSHGAGRKMSRTAAKKTLSPEAWHAQLRRAGVTLMSAGLDEAPDAYKDIHAVLAAQRDLVDVIGRFDPLVVRMADGRERPED